MTDRTINWVLRATDRTSQAFRSVDRNISGIAKSLKTFAGFAGFATIAAGVGSLARELIQLSSELQDASEKLGVSAEKLQVLKFAAEQTGGSFDSLQTALAFNTKLTGEAIRGNEKAAETFRLLGIDAKKFADLPIDRRLAVIAEQLKGVEDPALRLDLTIKALGRGGADLAPLLAQGAAGLAQFETQLRSTNSILSDEQVKALDDAGDAWDAFLLRLKVGSAPAFTATIGFLDDAIDKIKEYGSALLESRLYLRNSGFEIEPKEKPKGPTTRRPVGSLSAAERASIAAEAGTGTSNAQLADAKKAADEAARIAKRGADEIEREAKRIRDALASEVKGIFESTRTPQEEYFAGLDRIYKLQEQGAVSTELANRQVLALGQAYATAEQQQYAGTVAGAEYLDMVEDSKRIIAGIVTPFEAYGAELERIAQLQGEGLLNQQQAGRAVQQAGQDYAAAQIAIARGNDVLSDSTTTLLKELKTAADGFARDLTDVFFDSTQSIGDMFSNLANVIAKALFTATVSEPLVNSILGGFGDFFGGFRAAGGPVAGGKAYLVGERGPELFVPGQSGGIIPNGAGSSTPVQVNLTITSVDPTTAAQTIASQERLVTGMVRRAMIRAGVRPQMA